jgi:hypothetical protein
MTEGGPLAGKEGHVKWKRGGIIQVKLFDLGEESMGHVELIEVGVQDTHMGLRGGDADGTVWPEIDVMESGVAPRRGTRFVTNSLLIRLLLLPGQTQADATGKRNLSQVLAGGDTGRHELFEAGRIQNEAQGRMPKKFKGDRSQLLDKTSRFLRRHGTEPTQEEIGVGTQGRNGQTLDNGLTKDRANRKHVGPDGAPGQERANGAEQIQRQAAIDCQMKKPVKGSMGQSTSPFCDPGVESNRGNTLKPRVKQTRRLEERQGQKTNGVMFGTRQRLHEQTRASFGSLHSTGDEK